MAEIKKLNTVDENTEIPDMAPGVQAIEKVEFKSIDEAIKTFVTCRNELTEKRRAFEAEEKADKFYMEQIQAWLLEKSRELGVDSFASREHGTAFKSQKDKYQVSDWNAYLDWMKKTDNLHCVEKRCAKLAVKEIHNETGEVPPGLDYIVEITMDVRKAKT